MTSRIERLKELLAKKNQQALLVTHPANVSYLAGFKTHDSFLLATRTKNLLITDSRYSTEYRNLLRTDRIHVIEIEKTLLHALAALRKELRFSKLAFEENHVSVTFYNKLRPIFRAGLHPTQNIIEEMRSIKDSYELAVIRTAIRITQEAYAYAKKILEPGMKETTIAAEIERFVRLRGAQGTSFEIIVASGSNSSFPHAQITSRVIKNNEPVLIDMGVEYNGYKSDLTRVFFLGTMTPLFKKVYSIVQTAQQKALRSIRPGVVIENIDKQARNYIHSKGFGEYFKHSLGHGVGLEVHELPRISFKNKKRLKPGMVFTLEPAIYLDNQFGVRIEDMVLVTQQGAEVL